ncbi:RNA chaperone ProQ [Pasteurella atlantica]|uniref:RNA chaperone ProQ n=1 Tax=Pasteurella atlantica TaxID=2827233 RepID=A0AAW8CS77_9PAST|nr:RNA chaperone ProQ [Pasteurella atlantica]MBR0574421.1 RNA chaperone ProQ [Pasteurella atlantica]MDP8032901.1 RNA chaperone ProQ [Pasteurella atlantica]MDP8034942.1 RNA chaperone ProQ [Pasteurella atlantica]MDP8036788.1 RNA chaperone ProQ [Pasteurella atlantica]MDP8040340.1 RNA chaperone ProQ [Pasteurella atlantica]
MSEQQIEEQVTQTTKTTMSVKQTIAYLAEKFPLCFSIEGEAKPLKVGLFQDLALALEGDEKVSKTMLRQAMRGYTMGWRYLNACKEGAERVDLEGNPAGVIDADQALHAAQTLAESKKMVAERKAQQRKAERKEFFKKKTLEERKNDNATAQRKPRTEKVKKPENLTAIDTTEITKGTKVKVKIGSTVQAATVLAVEKQEARVQLTSGLILNVTFNTLFV